MASLLRPLGSQPQTSILAFISGGGGLRPFTLCRRGKQLFDVRATSALTTRTRPPSSLEGILGFPKVITPRLSIHPRYSLLETSRALSSSPPQPPEQKPPKELSSSTNTDTNTNSSSTSTSNSRLFSAGAGLIATGSILLGKTKYLLAALKVTKLASLGSMVVSIGAYSMVFGLPYAIGVVGQIALHESGHAYAMHKFGLPFSPMVFLPFVGAVIVLKDHPRDAYQDAIIAAAGPVAGAVAAAVISVAGHMNGSQLLISLADFGFMVNLFNLLPLGSMDGGRWAGAISPYIGVVGTGIGGYIAYNGLVANPLFYLIWLAGAYETFQRFYDPSHMPPNYYKITVLQRTGLTVGYIGLIAALLTAMSANQHGRKSPEELMRDRHQEVTWEMN